MATRRLEVELLVDDAQARAAFARTGRSVGLLEQQFGASGRRMAAVGSAVSTRFTQIGQAARTAAPFVAGGLALGIGKAVAEAREAEKAMAQTNAVIESTGGVANVTATQVGRLAERISEKAAIDDEAIQSGANLLLTFKNIRNEAGEGNQVFNQATSIITDMSVALDTDLKSAAIQVGKALNDPAVGLTALTRSGVTFTEQEREMIQTLFESGKQLKAQKIILRELRSEFEGSAKAQADAGDRLRVVFDNLAEDIGLKLLPELEDLGNEVADVLSAKNLTGEEKAGKLADILQERVQDGIDVLSDMAPEFAGVGAKLMGRMVEGFAEAWWDSDALGKLFLTGAFIRMIGGPGALGKIGAAIGRPVGEKMASTVATRFGEAAATDPRGKWGVVGRGIGTTLGAAAAVGFLAAYKDDILDTLGQDKNDEFWRAPLDNITEAFSGAEKDWDIGVLRAALRKLEDGFTHFSDVAVSDTRAVARAFQKLDDDVDGAVDNVNDAVRKGARATTQFSDKAWRDLDRAGDGAERNAGRRIPEALRDTGRALDTAGKASGRWESKASRDFDRVGDASKKQGSRVADNNASMVNAVLRGLSILGKETQEALKSYGVSKQVYQVGSAVAKGAEGVQFKQEGGRLVPGSGTGDSVPLMLPPDGGVLNRTAVNFFFGLQGGGAVPVMAEPGELAFDRWTPLLEMMNSAVPRFQKGGGLDFALGPYTIPPIQYDANHAGGNSHVHITGTTTPWVVSIGKQLQRMGFMVGEHPAFGGVQGTHSATGGHYDALAIDVNTANDETRSEVAQIARLLSGSGGGFAEKVARVILKGPKGAWLTGGQSILDTTHKAANSLLAKMAPSVTEGGISADGNVERVFAQVARKLSRSKTATLALGMAGYAESGMRDLDYGDSSSTGALQLLASTAAGMGINPHDEGAIASAFFLRGFFGKGGANALAAQGLPAHLVAQGVQGSAYASGSNYAAQKGPAQAWMRRFGLQRGGAVGLRGGGKGKGGPKLNIRPPQWLNPGSTMNPPNWWTPTNLPPAPLPPAAPITVENQLTALDIALTNAEDTDTVSDDAFVLMTRAKILAAERDRVSGELSNLTLSDAQRAAIQKQAEQRTAALRKKLEKGGLTHKERVELQKEQRRIQDQLSAAALAEKRTGLLEELNSLTGELSSTGDALKGLGEKQDEGDDLAQQLIDAQKAAAEEMRALRESIEAQNRILTSEVNVQRQELLRGIADLISGEIGGRIAANEYVPGYGAVATA